ncbi:MAG: diacylglycerol kinase family protein [Negativicutes bacterium]
MQNDMTVWIIYNPSAGAQQNAKINDLASQLISRNINLTVISTRDREDTVSAALKACWEMVHIITVAGGDGTLRDVINGIIHYKDQNSGPIPKVAIFPMGTANIVANRLGLDNTAQSVAKSLFSAKSSVLRSVKLNQNSFLLSVGLGIDAEIVSLVSPKLKKICSKLAYVYATLCVLTRKWNKRFIVEVDGTAHEVASLICLQGRHYAFSQPITSYLSTGENLTICLFKRGHRLDIIFYILYMLCGRLEKSRFVEIVSGTELCVKHYPSSWIQVDGDGFHIENAPIIISMNTDVSIEILL